MIREFRNTDMDRILEIWLEASERAHAFVEPGFWRARIPAMREMYLPASEVFVHEGEGGVNGFLALHGNDLAALFVSPLEQGGGIGARLLGQAKALRPWLALSVYKANVWATAFYLARGFRLERERQDEHTGEPELVLRWVRG